MRKFISLFLPFLFLPALMSAQEAGKAKIYGSVTNFVTFDSRETYTAACGLYSISPKDLEMSAAGVDLNASPKVRFLSVATRLGVDWGGFRMDNLSMSAKVEADFCSQVNGGAVFRLRDAYAKLGAEIPGDFKLSVLAGQTRHPMAADFPDVLSLNLGAPFNPYNFSPQLTLGCNFPGHFGVDVSALWQMQYASTGPEGVTNSYMNYGGVPEIYAALYYACEHLTVKLGGEMLSIKPRNKGIDLISGSSLPVSDRITTFSAMAYASYRTGLFSLKAKSLFSQAGEHLGLMGGYSVKAIDSSSSCSYTPYQLLSSWANASYGDRLKFSIFGGYIKNFGTVDPPLGSSASLFFANDAWNMNRMFRAVPSISYTMLKRHLMVGLEYEMTSVQYGDKGLYSALSYGLAGKNLRWVNNHRVELVVSCNF